MDALAMLDGYNQFDETLPSGLEVTLQLPQIADCIIAGGVPLPILQHVAQATANSTDDGQTASIEGMAGMRAFQKEVVRRSIVRIKGQPIEMTTRAVERLLQEDFDRVVALATRQETSPKAGTPT